MQYTRVYEHSPKWGISVWTLDEYYIPSTMNKTEGSGRSNRTATNLGYNSSLVFGDAEPRRIADFFVIYFDGTALNNRLKNGRSGLQNTTVKARAFECLLQFCVKSYHTSVYNGTARTEELGSSINAFPVQGSIFRALSYQGDDRPYYFNHSSTKAYEFDVQWLIPRSYPG